MPLQLPEPPRPTQACLRCLRRSALLASLSARLDHAAADLPRVLELLALDDDELIAALGGRRRLELTAAHRAFRLDDLHHPRGISTICPHSHGFEPPTLLHVAGSVERLGDADRTPLVAIVGSRRPSDYGRHVASQLATELASAGVLVGALCGEGVPAAALTGALDGGGAPLAIAASGLSACRPAHLHGLRQRVLRRGCVVSELPMHTPERRWSRRASARILVALAQLVIVVEGREGGLQQQLAKLAREQGRKVMAVPGRIGTRNSEAPHRLLAEGAPLLTCAQDALDLLFGVGEVLVPARSSQLPPRLVSVLERVGAGEDTLDRLLLCDDPAGTLLAVGELEALRLLSRGPRGRYLAHTLLTRQASV
jgi:DNA processing protein